MIKTIDEFIAEKRVIVKRKYTEAYPAQIASTAARVRNAILDAIGDGVITEDEMNRILSEIQAHKKWKTKNSKLFKVIEEDGIRKIKLSNKGKRIRNRTRELNENTISESLKLPHKNPGKNPVNVFVGRFQPFTLGHIEAFKKLHEKNGLPVIVLMVRNRRGNLDRAPISEDLQQSMFSALSKQYSFLESSYVIPNAGIDTVFSVTRPTYEPILWGYGSDRKQAYEYMINHPKYREQLNVNPDFNGYEISRTDDDISATKVRNALNIDDESTFKKMTPKSIHKFYKILQNELQPIQENNLYKMKHVKLFEEFVNESKINEKMTFKELVSKYKDNPYGIGANDIKYVESPGRDTRLILKFEDNRKRQEAIKKLKQLGIKSKNISKSTADRAFKYRYELAILESLNESHFKVGDNVTCIKSGMSGKIISLDKEDGSDDEKYYVVKREDGKEMKYAPSELELVSKTTENEQVTEVVIQEIDRKVRTFVIKNAKDYDYSIQDSVRQIYLSLEKLYPSLIK